MKLDSVEVPPLLKEMVKQVIKKAILSKELEPGIYYGIEEIVRQLNVSKTPVREALQDLETRGFVTLSSRRGVLINKLTEKEIIDFYKFRLVMEIAVIDQVVKLITDEDINVLRQYTELAKSYIQKNDRLNVSKYDREVHLYLARLTNNTFMIPQLERIRDFVEWLILQQRDRMAGAISEHDHVIQCLSIHDEKGAKRAMEIHIDNSLKNALCSLKMEAS